MTRKTISAQAVFNQAYRGLMRQGRRSVDYGICQYRGPNGLKCGVGHVVTDAECDGWDDLGDSAITKVADRQMLPPRLVPHLDLLTAIQAAHDNINASERRCKGEIRVGMAKVARQFALKIPTVAA